MSKFRHMCYVLTFDPAPKKVLFQGDAPEGNDTFQWPVIERNRVGGLRLYNMGQGECPTMPILTDAPEVSDL